MELNDKNRSADKWLDAALEHYSDAEPRLELESRILRRLRSEPEGRFNWGWRPAWVAVATIALLFAVVLLNSVPRHLKSIAGETSSARINVARVPETSPTPPVLATSGKAERTFHSRHAANLLAPTSWPAQFPSPRPLGVQEQLLSEYVRERPQEARLLARARTEQQQRDIHEFEVRGSISENLRPVE